MPRGAHREKKDNEGENEKGKERIKFHQSNENTQKKKKKKEYFQGSAKDFIVQPFLFAGNEKGKRFSIKSVDHFVFPLWLGIFPIPPYEKFDPSLKPVTSTGAAGPCVWCEVQFPLFPPPTSCD